MSGSIERRSVVSTATIAASGTKSGAISKAGYALVGLQLPAAMTGTSITFEVASGASATFVALRDDANAVISRTITQGTAQTLPPELACWPYFKIVSGGTEAAARTLILVMSG